MGEMLVLYGISWAAETSATGIGGYSEAGGGWKKGGEELEWEDAGKERKTKEVVDWEKDARMPFRCKKYETCVWGVGERDTMKKALLG
jgi:hypothetical protein